MFVIKYMVCLLYIYDRQALFYYDGLYNLENIIKPTRRGILINENNKKKGNNIMKIIVFILVLMSINNNAKIK